MTERKYPIYRFWMEFADCEYNVSGSRMFEEYLDADQGAQALQGFVDRNLDSERQGRDGEYTIRSLDLEIVETGWKFWREDTWCGGWFSHYTCSVRLTDEELLVSFQEYVDRYRDEQQRVGESVEEFLARVGDSYTCLMGAEDRWRWKGPCRCEHCRARGVVTIDH